MGVTAVVWGLVTAVDAASPPANTALFALALLALVAVAAAALAVGRGRSLG